MRLELFDFDLPRERIAQHPVSPRDAARLLVVGAGLEDRRVADLPALLRPGDLLVYNDTKVVPARLAGRRLNAAGGDAKVEITLHRDLGDDCWRAFARPARKLKPGDRLCFAEDFEARVLSREDGGEIGLRFTAAPGDLLQALERYGRMPLPPYITRTAAGEPGDREAYQTVFARDPGAVAAPTAGLHFTPELLARLEAAGVRRAAVTLHVGAGTFLPVTSARVEEHAMHAEWGRVDAAVVEAVAETRRAGGRVVAVGTTSLRLLESAAQDRGELAPFAGETKLFILPGFRFRVVDLLLTNFHLPRSTLFMLVSAFAGLDTMQEAYGHAKAAGYRFYSYGDACLLQVREDAGP